MAKKGTKIGDYTRPRLNKIIDQRVAAEISEGAGVDTTGTPADNQVAVFTDSNTLEGSENLTFDGADLGVSGKVFHAGDTDTFINFTDDDINIQAGGANMLDFTQDDGSQDEITFNEAGTDIDFRVESNNESHMLFMEASSNRISIGDSTNSPAATLEVTNHASAGAYNVPLIQLNSNDVDQIALDINAANTTANVIDITADAVTTGKVINITADALTAGSGSMLNLVSNSSSDSQRSLAKIVQDHTTPARTTLLHIVNDTENSTTLSPGTDFTSSYAPSVIIEHTGEPTHTALEFRNSYAADDSVYQVVLFNRTHAAVADGIGLGEIQFGAKNSANEGLVYAQISSQASDITNGDEGGKIAFEVSADGTGGTAALKNLLSIGGEDVAGGTPCAVTINEAGIDCDFRVEGDTETHLLFVDAGNERVSIGDSVDAPAATLEITNNNSAGAFNVPLLQLNNNDADQVALDINAGNTTANIIDIVADTLTTGAVINIVSDSSAANDRTLVKIHNDNTAAVGTKMLHIINDAVGATNDPLVIIESTAAETEHLLELRNSNAATDKPPVLCFNRSDTTSEADDMEIGTILFEAPTDGAIASVAFARIAAKATDITVRDLGGLIDFEVHAGGTAGNSDLHKLLSIGGEDVANSTPCEVVINEAGIDCDFRVESDGNTNMFFVDGGRNIVTVGADLGGGQAAGFAVVNDYTTSTFESLLGAGRCGSAEILRYSPGADDTLTAGRIHFLHTDGTWDPARADAVATGGSQMLCVGFGASARTTGVLLKGFIRIPSTEILNLPGSGAVDGLPLYVSKTAQGHFDFTAPSASGDFVRIVGYAIDDDSGDILVYFNPDSTFVEIA